MGETKTSNPFPLLLHFPCITLFAITFITLFAITFFNSNLSYFTFIGSIFFI